MEKSEESQKEEIEIKNAFLDYLEIENEVSLLLFLFKKQLLSSSVKVKNAIKLISLL